MKSDTMTIGEYAVGAWEFNECDCPIKAAGLKDSMWANEVAELFDHTARDTLSLGKNDETISEEDAKEVWDNLIEELEKMVAGSETYSEEDRHEAMLALAKEVTNELDWK